MKHTPTPWQLHPHNGNKPPTRVNMDTPSGFISNSSSISCANSKTILCEFTAVWGNTEYGGWREQDPNQMYANRDFMLHAVNMHDELMALVRELGDWSRKSDQWVNENEADYHAICGKVESILDAEETFLTREAI